MTNSSNCFFRTLLSLAIGFVASVVHVVPAFGNVTLEGVETSPGRPDVRVVQYYAKNAMRLDRFDSEATITTLVKPDVMYSCRKAKEQRLGNCMALTVESVSQLVGALMGPQGMTKIQKYVTRSLKRTDTIVGRRCEWFERIIESESDIAGFKARSMTKERFCADTSLSTEFSEKLYLRIMTPMLEQLRDKGPKSKAFQQERRAMGVQLRLDVETTMDMGGLAFPGAQPNAGSKGAEGKQGSTTRMVARKVVTGAIAPRNLEIPTDLYALPSPNPGPAKGGVGTGSGSRPKRQQKQPGKRQ